MLHSIFLTLIYLAFWYTICSIGSNYVLGFVSYFALLFKKKKLKRKKERPHKTCFLRPCHSPSHTWGLEKVLSAFWSGCTWRGFMIFKLRFVPRGNSRNLSRLVLLAVTRAEALSEREMNTTSFQTVRQTHEKRLQSDKQVSAPCHSATHGLWLPSLGAQPSDADPCGRKAPGLWHTITIWVWWKQLRSEATH